VTNRAAAALQDIRPLQVHGSFDATIETVRFEDLLPVLATRAPTAVAQYLRKVVRTLPARGLEGQRQMAIWLCELSPLLGSAEISLVQQTLGTLRGHATAWSTPDEAQQENTPQIAEAFLTLALLPQLEPNQRWDELLARPHQARDLFHLARWLAPVRETGLRMGSALFSKVQRIGGLSAYF
jgi:hypothetical protein